jgi:hypothetical protein
MRHICCIMTQIWALPPPPAPPVLKVQVGMGGGGGGLHTLTLSRSYSWTDSGYAGMIETKWRSSVL